MAFMERAGASVYYETEGAGAPVIAVHGLIENTAYWRLPGITARLASQYRVIAMDMRGHGRTVSPVESPGYDADTVAGDIEALADHLGLDRFYLLTHSTGGFAGSRWAMEHSDRLIGLILTDTTSATCPFAGTPEERAVFFEKFASSFERQTWEEVIAYAKRKPFPFFRGIAERPDNDAMWDMALEIVRTGDRTRIAGFVRSFYQDPDMKVDGLSNIACPALVLLGEKDDLFIEAGRIMAKAIPVCRHVVLEGVGHMTAIEAPDRLARELLDFMTFCSV